MKKVLVLRSKKNVKDRENLRKVLSENNSKDIEFVYARLSDVVLIFGGYDNDDSVTVNGIPITEYDLVIFRVWMKRRGIAITLAHYLRMMHIPFIDELVGQSLQGSKLSQAMLMYVNGLPIPKTMFCYKRHIKENIELIENHFEYPFIFKSVSGREGRDNYLITSRDHLYSTIGETSLQKFVIQEFIPNTHDYRILTVGDKVGTIYTRARKDDSTHLNNVAQGGKVEFLDMEETQEIADIALKAAHIQQKNLAGVDILISTEDERPYIIEVNSAPGLYQRPARKALYNYIKELTNKE